MQPDKIIKGLKFKSSTFAAKCEVSEVKGDKVDCDINPK